MLKSYLHRVALAAAVSLAGAGAFVAVAQEAPAPGSGASLGSYVEAGITKPYEERKLQFNQVGVVTEMNVKTGDRVEKGQVLAQLDTTVEEAGKKPLEIESKSMVQETYARADQGVKEQEYQRLLELQKTNNASRFEVEEGRLGVERAKASVELAIQEREIAKARIAELDSRIVLKTLKSPLNGFVQEITTGVGEVGGIDQQKYSFVIVQNDPLKVDVNIPLSQAGRLQVGQTMHVRYIDEDNAPWQPAKVIVMKPVADRGSQTRGIELELPNPNNKPAGHRVDVKLPESVAAN